MKTTVTINLPERNEYKEAIPNLGAVKICEEFEKRIVLNEFKTLDDFEDLLRQKCVDVGYSAEEVVDYGEPFERFIELSKDYISPDDCDEPENYEINLFRTALANYYEENVFLCIDSIIHNALIEIISSSELYIKLSSVFDNMEEDGLSNIRAILSRDSSITLLKDGVSDIEHFLTRGSY